MPYTPKLRSKLLILLGLTVPNAKLGLAVAQATIMAAPLEIAGSTTVNKTIIEPTQATALTATGVEPKMMPVGSTKGLQMLFEGRVAMAALSDSLEDSVADQRWEE